VEEDDTGSGQLERILKTDDHKLRTAADRVTLEKVIDKLAPGYRSMLVLHDVYGYEHSEICEIMGIRTGTSKSQVHKARKRLRLLLEVA
jgi:RNA polymerase sigma-70 factor (ECF subfamily)